MATAPVISEPVVDRFSSSAPTKPESGTRAVSKPDYEGQVRATLIQLGAGDPDGQINATRRFLEGCQDAGIDASVCAASIYSTVKHQHHGGTILREKGVAMENGAEEAGKWTRDNTRLKTWFERDRAHVDLQRKSDGRTIVEWWDEAVAEAIEDGFLNPKDYHGSAVEYANSVGITRIQRARENSAESPTREEWEVVVRRGGNSEDEVTAAAGRRPTQVTSGNAVFAGFNDDEKAQKFAQKMTQKGYVVSSGPSRESNLHEAAESAEETRPRGWYLDVMRGSHVTARYGPYVSKIAAAKALKKMGRPAPGTTVEVARYRASGHYMNNPAEKKKEVAEPAPVIHEAACEACIPWIKVTRDPHKHAEHMKLAAKHGPIKTPRQVYALVGPDMMKEGQEIFLVIPLNVRGELCCPPYEIARGQTSKIHVVEAREVLRAAFDSGCEGFIVVHNHPTGKCAPSDADIELTEQIKKATKVHGKALTMLDHVVIGNKQCFSIVENRLYKC